ncbi:hypothetical protein HBI56_218170 [Parastagonospora nodorum]|uniref:Uncharacterized protein n=1 Tax=Phaeosphaeria nodorum (strain SN15 / ATCC MYA-4574 / FGSC 10173) TaxID=321614 RepID=A0A7U2I4S1_PHANO|nr:hypothetical protein HBH56_225880 [Parastagonospora nodorum]QRD01835.1 hypothetical protein JI435_417250 [Parastagonospora nodorum SN15]KAH3935353.1 hypothetical protein HBH54_032840 [Parastagonospora nodorum]KAH3940073.1 hypothetical protein HBH53_223920 [Parastagonospora nodorum]KAH3957593.1 hypothetical protein HBH51_222780 [Parastagonospora nodorum]
MWLVRYATTYPVAIWGRNGSVIVGHLGLENLIQMSSGLIIRPRHYACLTLRSLGTTVLLMKEDAGQCSAPAAKKDGALFNVAL